MQRIATEGDFFHETNAEEEAGEEEQDSGRGQCAGLECLRRGTFDGDQAADPQNAKEKGDGEGAAKGAEAEIGKSTLRPETQGRERAPIDQQAAAN